MHHFELEKFVEIVLYVLEKTGGVDRYHLLKILYFAEMKHLAKWGVGIVPDTFCAMPLGPVPTELYDAIKELPHPKSALSKALSGVVSSAKDDASGILLPQRECNTDYVSESARQALDESIEENAHLLFSELMEKSHDEAWKEAKKSHMGIKPISPVSIAKVINRDEHFLEYIGEMAEINNCLQSRA